MERGRSAARQPAAQAAGARVTELEPAPLVILDKTSRYFEEQDIKYPIIIICSALIAGCATGYSPRYYFKQVDVVNLAGAPLTNLSWNVIGSGKQMTCGELAPNRVCGDYFARRPYPRAGIELSWTHTDGERQTALLNPPVPAYFYTTFSLGIFIEIDPEGTLHAFYRQDTPDDRIIPAK